MTRLQAIRQALRALDIEDARVRGPDGEDESPFGICTMGAEWLQSRLGGEVRGYYIDDNPSATVGEAEGGHDFLLLPDYIVDWWGSRYIGGPELLHRVRDAKTIARLYGDESRWESGGSNRTDHLGAATIPAGDCFRWATQTAQTMPGSYVVHAMVQPPHYKKAIPHAWVEYMEPDESGYPKVMVIDYQRNVMGQGPQLYEDYAFLMHPRRVKRYTHFEALKLAARTRHWGPWP